MLRSGCSKVAVDSGLCTAVYTVEWTDWTGGECAPDGQNRFGIWWLETPTDYCVVYPTFFPQFL